MVIRKKIITTLAVLAISVVPYAAFASSTTTSTPATSGLAETQALLAQLQAQTEKNANAYASAAAVEPPAYIKNGTPNPNTTSAIVIGISPAPTSATDSSATDSNDNDEGFSQFMPVVKETSGINPTPTITPAAAEEINQEIAQESIEPYAEAIDTATAKAWSDEYSKNTLQSFQLTLNQKTYSFNLPNKNLGYNVSSSSTYNRTNGVIADTFTTKVVTEAIVNDSPLRIIIELKQPVDEIAQLKGMHNTPVVNANNLSKIFAFNESVDGVKAAPNYNYVNTANDFIPLKSDYMSVPNGDKRPYSMAMIALSDTTLATVTISSNHSDDYKLVRSTAYSIATSVTTSAYSATTAK